MIFDKVFIVTLFFYMKKFLIPFVLIKYNKYRDKYEIKYGI